MARKNHKLISARDCSSFDNFDHIGDDSIEILQHFSRDFLSNDNSVFHFLANERNKEEDVPFAQWLRDANDENKWKLFAGRWVGATAIIKGEKSYSIKVSPRFGDISLFALLDELFSINVLNNNSDWDKLTIDNLLQKLIPFIWAKKLGDANRYGIPHTDVYVLHKGPNIKGRLLIRKSIMPFFKQSEVISATREKQVDATICRIILQAYDILKREMDKNIRQKLNDSAYNALLNFENAIIPKTQVSPKQYGGIRYKSIYESWKDVVDLSWQIIQHHHFSQKESDTQKGFGMFVDMAEIWEMFLRSKLRKAFPDWNVSSPEITTYNETFFKRKIIPDIVMIKGNDVMVFDAKWKRMECRFDDVDRADFFQIHTYIQHYHRKGNNVIAGGLLYPISLEEKNLIINRTSALHGIDESTIFIVDGICFGNEIENGANGKMSEDAWKEKKLMFEANTEAFLGRIKKLIK